MNDSRIVRQLDVHSHLHCSITPYSVTSNCANPSLKGGELALTLPLMGRELVRALLRIIQAM
jgi:hypothetical protein